MSYVRLFQVDVLEAFVLQIFYLADQIGIENIQNKKVIPQIPL